MRATRLGWLMFVAVASCASPAPSAASAARPRDPSAQRAEREIARLESERSVLRRAEAERALAGTATLTGPLERRRAVIRAIRLDPSWLLDYEPADIAAFAPDVLRVYDLGAALDDGSDDADLMPPEHSDRVLDGDEAFLRRIADESPGLGWRDDGEKIIRVAGSCLVVVQSPEGFASFERALDGAATVAGRSVRVKATVTRPGGVAIDPLVFDVPYGRRRQAWDGTQTSYVQDFDVDAGSALGDPRIGVMKDGVWVAATFLDGRVVLEVTTSELVLPMQEVTSRIVDERPGGSASGGALRLQVPQWRVERDSRWVAPRASPSFLLAGVRIDVDVDYTEKYAPPPRPGWRRVEPSTTARTATAEPLVDNALLLAAARLHGEGPAAPSEALSSATLLARGAVWTRRVRPDPDAPEAVLLRRPVGRPREDVLAALRAADVRVPDRFGFLDVRDGVLAACIVPQSEGALRRALDALDRHSAGSKSLRITSAHPAAEPGCCDRPPGRCAVVTLVDTEQISFIQDFDLSLTDDSAIGDPIVGILQNGAAVSARPVGSDPDLFEVTVKHSVVPRPIPTFATSLGAGSPVTIQLPRLRCRTQTLRVRLAHGAATDVASVVRLGTGADERRFTLIRE